MKCPYYWNSTMKLRPRIFGMLAGGAIGDSWGFPVEVWSPERIMSTYPGGVSGYVDPIGHKWFKPETMPAGSVTDDTQLTLATIEGLIAGYEAAENSRAWRDYMDAIAHAHCEAMNKTTAGWGGTSRDAVKSLCKGVSWTESGVSGEKRGTGNGVPMKISPLAAWHCSPVALNFPKRMNARCVQFSAMTHYTRMSAEAAIWHNSFVYLTLLSDPETYRPWDTFDTVFDILWGDKERQDHAAFDLSHLTDCADQLKKPFTRLSELRESLPYLTLDQLRQEFGNGSCYVYNSLPFTYAGFLRSQPSMDTIKWLVNAGGDTDTNAKMAGELVGALYGLDYFERVENRWALEGLRPIYKIIQLGIQFCNTFGIME